MKLSPSATTAVVLAPGLATAVDEPAKPAMATTASAADTSRLTIAQWVRTMAAP